MSERKALQNWYDGLVGTEEVYAHRTGEVKSITEIMEECLCANKTDENLLALMKQMEEECFEETGERRTFTEIIGAVLDIGAGETSAEVMEAVMDTIEWE